MYEEFYRLAACPFRSIPDPEYIYWTEGHTMAFTMLRYSLLSRAPITVVTGDIGAGKTTLIRRLLSEIPEDLEVGLISNMQAERGELLHWVMTAFGHEIGDEPYVTLFQRFQTFLVDRYAANRRVVLIFDEAQNISTRQLEELRMLSNINADKDDILQIVLVGQPQLRDLLNQPELTQFVQRIASDFNLTPLTAAETGRYIEHRLTVAQASWRIFAPDTVPTIHAASRGVPRLINILCDLALVYGYASEQRVVTDTLLREFLTAAQTRGLYQQFSAPQPRAAASTIPVCPPATID